MCLCSETDNYPFQDKEVYKQTFEKGGAAPFCWYKVMMDGYTNEDDKGPTSYLIFLILFHSQSLKPSLWIVIGFSNLSFSLRENRTMCAWPNLESWQLHKPVKPSLLRSSTLDIGYRSRSPMNLTLICLRGLKDSVPTLDSELRIL
jgi:hypothetical protein